MTIPLPLPATNVFFCIETSEDVFALCVTPVLRSSRPRESGLTAGCLHPKNPNLIVGVGNYNYVVVLVALVLLKDRRRWRTSR